MKKIMIIGSVSFGKTTLCQALSGRELLCRKTQTIEVIGNILDTPGEYFDNYSLTKALIVSAVDVDAVLLLQDCTSSVCNFSPGQAAMFSVPTIGVVTKTDLASAKRQIIEARRALRLAGVEKIFCVSGATGEGIMELLDFLRE